MKFLKILFNILMWIILSVFPKSKKYVIVGGWYGERYADNSRYMYEYLCLHKNELGILKVFWFTKSEKIKKRLEKQGKDVLYGYSIKSIYWHLRSKIHMIDQNPRDILGFLSVRCIRINLWHGMPLKNFGYLQKGEEPKRGLQKKIDILASGGFWNNALYVATSEFAGMLISKAMAVPLEKVLISSYPRTVKLYKEREKCGLEKFCIFYLPTFRNNNMINPLLNLDLTKVDEYFQKKKIKLLVKPHYADMSNWEVIGRMRNIQLLDSGEDVYEWLYKTDLLITDYSSVYFDYLLTKSPIIFFPYDYDYYKNQDRGFTVPYEKYTPGRKVYTGNELLEMIDYVYDHIEEYKAEYNDQYEWVLTRIHKYTEKMDISEITKIWS